MISIKDIAKEAGVSISTVSRVMNNSGYVKATTRKAVIQAIEKMNYRPSAIAQSMVRQQSKIIGLVMPYFRAPFFAGLVDSIEKRANELGYNIMLCLTDENTDKEKEYLNLLNARRVDGILLLPVSQQWDHIYTVNQNTPLVLVSRRSPDGVLSCVRANDVQGSYAVVSHLLDTGRRQIYCITGHTNMMNSNDRVEGIHRAFSERGLDPEAVISASAPINFEGGYQATHQLLNNHPLPEAIYAVNPMMALGAVKALLEKNLSIPEDIALASFAGLDELQYAELIQPQISANIYPTREIGQASINLLDEIITAWDADQEKPLPRDITFNSRFVVRASTQTKT